MNKLMVKGSGASVVLVLVGFVIAYQFVEPAPPSRLTMATGSSTGAYHRFALEVRDILAQSGVELDLLNTAGSKENASLLAKGDVDIALIQGGTSLGGVTGSEQLRSLGSLYYEPLWIFHRINPAPSGMQDLVGRRLSRGVKGSGTRELVDELFALNGMAGQESAELSNSDASAALMNGELDAVFMVGGEESPDVRVLLDATDVRLMDVPRAEAYHLHRRYLSALTLPAGAISLATHRPPEDRRLVGVTAMLVAREDLHPALVDLLLLSSQPIVDKPGLFSTAGQFPSGQYLSVPLDEDARRFHERGPSFLQRYLPFWAATLVDRLIVMLVPLVGLALPLLKVFPPVYRWRVRSRIYRWYADLKRIEMKLDSGEAGPDLIEAIQRLDDEVKHVETPLSYTDELYRLREHIDMVGKRIRKQVQLT
jgi:TRAP transporter TAXI family solute receptor